MKILVTMGTSKEYNFRRLLKIIDLLCDKNVIDSKKLVVQSNDEDYIPRNYEIMQTMPNEKFKDIMVSADLVISHAGTGTITTALKLNKKVIVFPRLREYGEHIDNHQLQICQLFEKKGYIMIAKNEKELECAIKDINNYTFNVFESNTDMFIEQLEKIIRKLFYES